MKYSSVSGNKAWTHYAIPRGLEGDTPMPTHQTLRKGASGPDVVECQEALLALGYDLAPYGADGKYGSMTIREVKKFQKASGLAADGICGPKTWAALEDAQPGPDPKPEPAEDRYTVTIPGISLQQAEELCKEWSGASMKKE